MLGAVAHATERVELMTYVPCPTICYHPAVVAQKAATRGVLSDGRFTLGLGSGENLNEHGVGEVRPAVAKRQDMLQEAVIATEPTPELVTEWARVRTGKGLPTSRTDTFRWFAGGRHVNAGPPHHRSLRTSAAQSLAFVVVRVGQGWCRTWLAADGREGLAGECGFAGGVGVHG